MRKKFRNVVFNRVKKGDIRFFYDISKKYLLISLSILKNKPLTGPMLGIIVPTYRCNLRCKMCNFWKKENQKELTTKEFFKVIDNFSEMDTSMISFSGGEPLLRSDIFDIIKYAKKRMGVHIATNGTLITKNIAKKICDLEVDGVSISLDATDPIVHDRIRGVPGSFKKTINGLKNISTICKNTKTSVDVVSLISEDNFNEIPKITKLIKEIEIETIGIIPIHDINNNGCTVGINPKNTQNINKIIDELISIKRQGGSVDNSIKYLKQVKKYFKGTQRIIPCSAGLTTCVVDPYGDIFPCYGFYEMGNKIANVKKGGLKEIWFSEDYDNLRKGLFNCKKCIWNCHFEFDAAFRIPLKIREMMGG